MRLAAPELDPAASLCNEIELLLHHISLRDADLLELGCGKADKTRQLAERGQLRSLLALEVDTIQHQHNLAIRDLPTVRFAHGGAEAIPAADGSMDGVLLFKSLHHVPLALMDQALDEIARVLKPGGWAWISEPVFAGELNEVFRLFHNEEQVRAAAFAAIGRAVDRGRLRLERQLFFHTRSSFTDFAQFEARMIRVTHTDHQLSPELLRRVQERFDLYHQRNGGTFLTPQRVDLLRKPG